MRTNVEHGSMGRGLFGGLRVGCILLVAIASGCTTLNNTFNTSERLLPKVLEDGDRAYERGNYAKAEADYAEYVARKPNDAKVRHQWADTLIKTGQPSQAVENAAIAYSANPDNEAYIETYAEALIQANRKDQLFDLLRSQATDRGRISDYDRLGRFSARAGDADGAEEALQFAAKLDRGTTIKPQLALADFYHSIGDKKKELERLRMALAIEPVNQDVYKRIQAMGHIAGPSFALTPAERE